ncbi:hypothetical protein BP6252_07009 [Coleophoma cylindrospora]|uniref:Uracil-DNA glycosylase-like domain-containing protein n=1 Tax=Coleophoma cylindrospora TaxID=1849047 RepID=A0A3D8RGD5_9HELO|nr:hypothetical protein BP6252_07009 [Coleophoma cylindrospora]
MSLPAEDDYSDATATSTTTTPASFAGRLDLANFAFSPKLAISSTNPIRSLRRTTSTSRPQPKRRSSNSLEPSHSPSPSKKRRSLSGYAPPSKYAHLPLLPDVIAPQLLVLFIGLNPGLQTSIQGHAYAHPSNLFWKLLHSSGCTDRRLHPSEDASLPLLYSMGYTNIVARPTRNGAELSKAEMDASVLALEEKIQKFRPEAVAVVGKSIWESIWRVRYGRPIKKDEFKYGWQDDKERMGTSDDWEGAKVFAATSTSGLAATPLPAEKERIWRDLGTWVEQRRVEQSSGASVNPTQDPSHEV